MPDMHGKKLFAGGVFILLGVLSVDAWFSLPLQRSKLNDNRSIGYASAWTDRWGNSLGRALLGGSGTENAELSARVLHSALYFYTEELYTEELYTADLLHREACTQGGLYKQNLLHRETFTQERFYTQKLLHTEVFIHTE